VNERFDLLIVGAGPAGLAACRAATEHGLRVALIDERRTLGGSVSGELGTSAVDPASCWLTPAIGANDDDRATLAPYLGAHGAAHVELDAVAWGLFPGWTLAVATQGATRRFDADQIVLATGRYVERPVFPGHQLDGVVTPLGLLHAIDHGQARRGDRLVLLGEGPMVRTVATMADAAGLELVAQLSDGSRSGGGWAAAQQVELERLALTGAPRAGGARRLERVDAPLADGVRRLSTDWCCVCGPDAAATELAGMAGVAIRFAGYGTGFRPVRGLDGSTNAPGCFAAGASARAAAPARPPARRRDRLPLHRPHRRRCPRRHRRRRALTRRRQASGQSRHGPMPRARLSPPRRPRPGLGRPGRRRQLARHAPARTDQAAAGEAPGRAQGACMTRPYDVAVVGGGVLGNFIAYYLARAGQRTALIERGYTAGGTSGATHAWIYVSTKTPGFYGRFSYESSLLYEALEREHGVDFQYERSGGLSILWSEAAVAAAHALVAEQNAAGVDCEVLTPEQAAAREPILDPAGIYGAVYGPLDGCVNPFAVMFHMNALARSAGVDFHPYTEVTALTRHSDDHGFSIEHPNGRIEAGKVVLAGGVWTRELARMLGFEAPIRPSRGQVLVSEPMPPTVQHILANGSIRQLRERGIILFGRVMENDQTANLNTYDGIQAALRDVLTMAPAMGDVRVVRSYAGIRPKPFDDLPVLGEVPGHAGVFTAVTHSGVTLGPIIGLSLAELVTGSPTSYDLAPYGWDRVARGA